MFFQISDFSLRNNEQLTKVYNNLFDLLSNIEVKIYILPQSINSKSSVLDSNIFEKVNSPELQDYLNELSQLTNQLPDNMTKVNLSFLIVDKEKSEEVINKLNQLSFSLRNINSDEAKSITV